jgi:hypothetical protein
MRWARQIAHTGEMRKERKKWRALVNTVVNFRVSLKEENIVTE